eukprot:TRINITY_DN14747_c0_g1_i1.p1 TRINITY_DN14747_c0_g1~~TRINITY_DN14747_c0_g1_i1.p1  ORF type:complete len:344 (+),score=93.62 TRINITY_DN14747_c0_g1_i1:118-1149(+)
MEEPQHGIDVNGLSDRAGTANLRWSQPDEDDDKPLTFQSLTRNILIDSDAKKLFVFIVLVCCMTLVEIVFGSMTGSLGLLSLGFHSAFDLLCLVTSLAAILLAKHKPTKSFSYGYSRFEILSSFSNGTFLMFIAMFLTFEALHRFVEPVEIERDELATVLTVTVLGLVVRLIGVLFFRQYGWALVRAETRHMGAHQENLASVMTLIVLDACSYVAVICSTWLLHWGWSSADQVVTIGVVVLMYRTGYPIIKRTAAVLLQTTPSTIKDQLQKALREAATLDGVLEYRNEHFWTQAPGEFVGSVYVRVRSDVNEEGVRQRVHALFQPIVSQLTVQIEKDDYSVRM